MLFLFAFKGNPIGNNTTTRTMQSAHRKGLSKSLPLPLCASLNENQFKIHEDLHYTGRTGIHAKDSTDRKKR